METKEIKKLLEEYFKLTFVVIKPDFNNYFIQFLVGSEITHFNYKWNNYFDKETNLSTICNQIKDKIVLSFIR